MQVYNLLLIENYDTMNKIKILTLSILEKQIPENPNVWFIFMRNTIITATVITVVNHYKNVYLIIKEISTIEGMSKLVKQIYLSGFHNKVTYVQFIEILKKLGLF